MRRQFGALALGRPTSLEDGLLLMCYWVTQLGQVTLVLELINLIFLGDHNRDKISLKDFFFSWVLHRWNRKRWCLIVIPSSDILRLRSICYSTHPTNTPPYILLLLARSRQF